MNSETNFREIEAINEKSIENVVISGRMEEMYLDNLMGCIGCI